MPLSSAVRSPGSSLALVTRGAVYLSPWSSRPPISPEAYDMASEPLAWPSRPRRGQASLLCVRAGVTQCSATELRSHLSPGGGIGAWLSGDRPAGEPL